jgi:hypothetical protein
MHFSIVLGGLAVGLLNFGDKLSKIFGACYTLIGTSHPRFFSILFAPSGFLSAFLSIGLT